MSHGAGGEVMGDLIKEALMLWMTGPPYLWEIMKLF